MSDMFDCIIVGGGLAGLTCANRVAENGGKPLVLEQGEAEQYPCNSRYSGGIVHVAFKDLRASREDIDAAVRRQVVNEPATALASILADDGNEALEWLRSEGTKFVKGGALEFMRWILAPPRPRRPGLDWKGRGPDVTLRNLTKRLNERGGEVRRGTRAVGIVQSGESITGVAVEHDGERSVLPTSTVVIADGGFQGNPDRVREFICAAPQALFQRGAGTGRGDGLSMAMELGADTVGMDRFYGHLLGRSVFENEKLWPYPTVDAIAQASLIVDDDGKRFADEGRGGVYLANQVARLANPLGATVIFDEAVWTGIAADNRYPPCMNPSFEAVGGEVLAANSLAELAQQIDVDPQTLSHTVDEYNQAVQTDGLESLSVARTPGATAAQAIATAPFRAIKVCAGMTYTMGGVRIDADSRVLRADGTSISGLYAIGSASGGMEGGQNAAYIGGLAKAVVTGLRAAASISAGAGMTTS